MNSESKRDHKGVWGKREDDCQHLLRRSRDAREAETTRRTWRAGVKRTRADDAARLTMNIAMYLEPKGKRDGQSKISLGRCEKARRERIRRDSPAPWNLAAEGSKGRRQKVSSSCNSDRILQQKSEEMNPLDSHQSVVNVFSLSSVPLEERVLDLRSVEEVDVRYHRGQGSEGECVGDGEVRSEKERSSRLEGSLVERERWSENGADVEAEEARRKLVLDARSREEGEEEDSLREV